MGCDGCELWNGTRRICYAGTQTERYAGKKGWPEAFNIPKLFIERLPDALKWKDLTGTEREGKPWLNGYPRIVFLNDMGDTFSKNLPLHWLATVLPQMAQSPHQFLMLTKRPSRAFEFSKRFPFPQNFWIGTSVTSEATAGRIKYLFEIQGGSVRFVSFEPLWSAISPEHFQRLDWSIFGGESGLDPTETDCSQIVDALGAIAGTRGKAFVKQLGGRPVVPRFIPGQGIIRERLILKDAMHGGDWNEWRDELRVRDMPAPHLADLQLK